MSDSNAMIVRKAYQDFAQGNIPAVFTAFDPSIDWHVPGHSPLSGDYNGHETGFSFRVPGTASESRTRWFATSRHCHAGRGLDGSAIWLH